MRKPGPMKELPPPMELVCLKALWEVEEGTIHDIHKILKQTRPIAYTTVLTLAERLVKRGAADRRKVGRGYVYKSMLDLRGARAKAITEIAEIYFSGSTAELRRFLDDTPVAESSESNRRSSNDVTLL